MYNPQNENELAQAIRDARNPISIRGGATRLDPSDGDTLSTAGLSGVTLYEPGALTIVAGAGTPLDVIEETLAAEGQRLPFEPSDMRKLLGRGGTSTIGGVVAASASGPRRIQAGAVRDSLIGVGFVDGQGHVLRNGGRVMKNVTGYDLVKLLAGSHGTLGVLSEVSFKVLPTPPSRAVLLIDGLTPAAAVDAMSAALASPYEVNGAAHTTSGLDNEPVTMIRVEGFEGAVEARAEALSEKLGGFGKVAIERDPDRTARGWAWVRDVEAFADKTGDVWRVSVKPSDAPALIDAVAPLGTLMDWGGGLVWFLAEPGQDVRADMSGIPGHATLVRSAAHEFPRFQPEHPAIAKISQGLREKFDPRGILNPGLMG